ncbi:hypothetical protein GCM10010911_03940 [Paenibacillus nasutitermitis]|uniref:Uncharacterized protein n=1 Tax=Paenibacillus nasutitermitis TaxID=1652958 RepID=A0A916YK60_9BACL|nr:hypothetical protein GCM10010911_03940 [Paenibacillus nasutitermitis]
MAEVIVIELGSTNDLEISSFNSVLNIEGAVIPSDQDAADPSEYRSGSGIFTPLSSFTGKSPG